MSTPYSNAGIDRLEEFAGKRVLVTGATGTIGPLLVKRLRSVGSVVTATSLDSMARAEAVLGGSFLVPAMRPSRPSSLQTSHRRRRLCISLDGREGKYSTRRF